MRKVGTSRLLLLKAEIASDLEAIDRIGEAVSEAMLAVAPGQVPSPVVQSGLALYLHDFYQAVEQMLTRITRTLNGFDTAGESWHIDLLRLASREIEGLRPAVISESTMRDLDRYRGFRHFVRHGYDRDLMWDRMQGLIESLPEMVASFRQDTGAFLDVLTQMINEIERRQS
ncbi:MAG: hypothetical protein KA063_05435 [Firmicutes bacterium]|nr:hypothetical protein [Bacillota bacterium]